MSADVNRMQSRRNELLSDVASHTAELVRDHGVPDEVARQIGDAVADALADHWGGQIITFPKNYFFRLAQRDQAVLAEHRAGATYGALAKQYNMTERGIRRLIRRAELRDRDSRQKQLFAAES